MSPDPNGRRDPLVSGDEPTDFDARLLRDYLLRAIPGLEGPMHLERIGGGQSNPTFFVTFAQRMLVLRKQPAGPVLPSAHAVDREFRIIRALAATDVPVPSALLFEPGRDVVGTPFYVMDRLDGRVFHDNALPDAPAHTRRAVYASAAETLAKLHRVDWTGLGLTDFGKPGNYYGRQIARWTKQHELSQGEHNGDLERLIDWLPRHVPEDDLTTIVHGDYRIGNLMIGSDGTHVAGVLDWELSTLGHPLADLAHSAMAWHSTPPEYGGLLGLDLEALNLPLESEYTEAYYRACGHTARMGRFHMAFALFRFAVVFEGIAARARAGSASASNAAEVGPLAKAFARRAIEVLDGTLHSA